MKMSIQDNVTLNLPRNFVWKLLTNMDARHLWQPNLSSVCPLSGDLEDWKKGTIRKLTYLRQEKPIEVIEKISSSRFEDKLVFTQKWPNHTIRYVFVFSGSSQETTKIYFQKHYKAEGLLSSVKSTVTQSSLRDSSQKELNALLNVTKELSSRLKSNSKLESRKAG